MPAGERHPSEGMLPFLRTALAAVLRREMLFPAAHLLVILTFSNIVILQNLPEKGSTPPWQFITAAAVRLISLVVLVVAILRIANDSKRRPWRLDGAFFLYPPTFVIGLGINVVVGLLLGGRDDLLMLIVSNVLVTVLLAPFAVWVVAIAVERPLAWRPWPWLRGFRRWLPPLLFWTLLLVSPMAVLHAWIDSRLLEGAGDWFWPAALFDGALSAVMALIGLGINSAAYRSVARR